MPDGAIHLIARLKNAMKNPAFTTKARRIGIRLALRSLLVYGSLVLGIFLVGVVVLIILDESVRLLVGAAIAAGALASWWLFVRPFQSIPTASCPCCGGLAL